MSFEYFKNHTTVFVPKYSFTTTTGETCHSGELLQSVGFSEDGVLVKFVNDHNKEYTVNFNDTLNMDYFYRGVKNPINVGDSVWVLFDARKVKGTVSKVNKKTFKVNLHGAKSFQNVEERLFEKDRVANYEDCCTIVCDYKKDPNGMSVRFVYDLDFYKTHKPLSEWGSEPYSFESLN